ncbi:MAG: [FeFe] hydrogenase H-cluster radical SAM maturase HydG [Oscillospiraceae bacterium]|nr:[FeFe] hydrogenase H-cluster radical SAM maturase HydG [Oscillospiraceae bacterium]
MPYDRLSPHARDFLDHDEIVATLKWADENKDNQPLIAQVMQKAAENKGLDHREASLLLAGGREDALFALAGKIKEQFYGSRVVLFAPLYLSNHCVNGCVYCPYNCGNKDMPRRKLTQDEIREQVIALQDMGHKRLALEAGEHPKHNPIDYILESIETIYNVKHKNGAIRRVNVNIAATTIENYQKLKAAEIGTYILFQETYHRPTYNQIHPSGPKSDYDWQAEAMDRAMQGGIDDVGVGALFGLYDYRYEFAALLMHAEHLEAAFGVGPHTVSVPRIRKAQGVSADRWQGVDDQAFARIVACLRISAPYTGIIVSTRESEESRRKLLNVGVSQISGGSKTSVGGYGQEEAPKSGQTEQFEVSDSRTLGEVVRWLVETGHIPSFCTACYREGRVGDRFMELCKSGQIQNCCHPNALMTLQEYLLDYANTETRQAGEALIGDELANIPNEKMRALVGDHLGKIKAGSRDFRV